jgi:hypothetical protein
VAGEPLLAALRTILAPSEVSRAYIPQSVEPKPGMRRVGCPLSFHLIRGRRGKCISPFLGVAGIQTHASLRRAILVDNGHHRRGNSKPEAYEGGTR